MQRIDCDIGVQELIQNADDAGATEVILCLDHRRLSTDSALSAKMAQFQGPALLAYNSAMFTDKDFESIQRIGDSLKKEHSAGTKTGRFGIGFNSGVCVFVSLPASCLALCGWARVHKSHYHFHGTVWLLVCVLSLPFDGVTRLCV